MSSASEPAPGGPGSPEERPTAYDGGSGSSTPGDTGPDTGASSTKHAVESDKGQSHDSDSSLASALTGDLGPSSRDPWEGSSPAWRPATPADAAPAVRRYDWPTIKRRYIEGVQEGDAEMMTWPTLDDVARHFEATPQRVREKSAQEGWVEERNRWQAQVEATRRQTRAAALARHATDLDGRALDTAQLGLQLCKTRLQEIAQAAQARRTEGAGRADAAGLGIDAQEQQRLAQAVDLWHKVGLRAIGDPETHRLEISGPNGRPLEIAHELRRDDPGRITGVLAVLRSAGLGDLFGVGDDPGGEAPGYGRADGDAGALEARR